MPVQLAHPGHHRPAPSSTTLGNLVRWKAGGRGPLDLQRRRGRRRSFSHRAGLPAPDMQFHVAPAGFYDNGLTSPPGAGLTIAPTLVHVRSRGSLRLRSADPRWHPEIDAGYFDDSADLDAMVAGVRMALEIAPGAAGAVHRPAVACPLGRPDRRRHPSSRSRRPDQTLYHPVGTCAMGTVEGGVVDPELKVRGVEGLRVVDASVHAAPSPAATPTHPRSWSPRRPPT